MKGAKWAIMYYVLWGGIVIVLFFVFSGVIFGLEGVARETQEKSVDPRYIWKSLRTSNVILLTDEGGR